MAFLTHRQAKVFAVNNLEVARKLAKDYASQNGLRLTLVERTNRPPAINNTETQVVSMTACLTDDYYVYLALFEEKKAAL